MTAVKVWSTAQVHPRDRLAYWVDQICANCCVDSEPRPDPRFFGEGVLTDLAGMLQIVNGVSTAQVIRRSSRQIARGNGGHFHVTVMSSGRTQASQDGREAVLGPGDFVIADHTREYQFTYDTDVTQTLLIIPRQSLLDRIGRAERFTARKIDGSKGFGGLLSPMLQNLGAQLRDVPSDMQARIAGNVLDLIATAVLSEHDEVRVSSEMTHVRIKFWIETHLVEELSGERIAAACGVSVRHLNRLFAREATSLMHYVWERRLARCRRDLMDPAMAHHPIGDIALSAGFKDLAHFSRAYRARYGRSASEDRTGLNRGPA
jgi:AraC-like DNA-binding protein